MPTVVPQDAGPITAARFSITIDGVEIASFSELSAITSELETPSYLEQAGPGVSPTTRVLGRRRPPTVVLTRGNDSSMALWEWHDAAVRGNWGAARKNCSLIMYNYEGKLIARYHLDQAWPAKLELHGIKAGAGERLTETVTIVCDNIHRMVP